MGDLVSLSSAVDIANERLFFGSAFSETERSELSEWIARRQGVEYAYGELFGLNEQDRLQGVRLFTGERIAYGASARHVLGEEALRVLKLMDVHSVEVVSSIKRAEEYMTQRLQKSHDQRGEGIYCCTGCAPAVWRSLSAGVDLGVDPQAWLDAGVAYLRGFRDGNGKWRSFRFYYTLLALAGFDYPQVVDELRYTRPALEKALHQTGNTSAYATRRRRLIENILEEVN
jgi:hypothetical protein